MPRIVPSAIRSQFGGQIIGNEYLVVVDVMEKIAILIDIGSDARVPIDQLPAKVAEYLERNAETEYNLGFEAGAESSFQQITVDAPPNSEDIAKAEIALREEPVAPKGRRKS